LQAGSVRYFAEFFFQAWRSQERADIESARKGNGSYGNYVPSFSLRPLGYGPAKGRSLIPLWRKRTGERGRMRKEGEVGKCVRRDAINLVCTGYCVANMV